MTGRKKPRCVLSTIMTGLLFWFSTLALFLVPHSVAGETVIDVKSYLDSTDGDCTTGGSTTCNLRAAIVASQSLSASDDVTIRLPSDQEHLFNHGELATVTWSVTIESSVVGANVTLNGAGNGGRFLRVSGSGGIVVVGDGMKWTGFAVSMSSCSSPYTECAGGAFYVASGASLTIGGDCESLIQTTRHT